MQPIHFLQINPKAPNHLALQIRTSPHAPLPQREFPTSCSKPVHTVKITTYE